jgi:UrcA family protein
MKSLTFVAAAIACLIAGAASAQPADADGIGAAQRRVVLRFGELDINHGPGAAIMVARIRQAAETVCGPDLGQIDLGSRSRYRACVQASAGAAVRRLDAPLVTAVYQGGDQSLRVANR